MGTELTLLEHLKPVISGTRKEICLAAMAYLAANGFDGITAADLKKQLVAARVPKARQFNVADVLGKAGELVEAKGSAQGNIWTLTGTGRTYVDARIPPVSVAPEVTNTLAGLSAVLSAVTDPVIHGYVNEALLCYQANARRATVVFLWSGVIRHLQEEAWKQGSAAVSAAVLKHDSRVKPLKKFEDFATVNDKTQLLAFRELSIIDKGEWTTLGEALDLRNRCGHPTKYKPGIAKVAAFVEDVVGIAFTP